MPPPTATRSCFDIFYNRHNSLKISHWLDTLLVDYGSFVGAPPGQYQEPPPEYIYASDVSVFFDRDLDFGDAPDKPYRTWLANDGARHAMPSALYLGAVAPDAEPDGLPGPLAQGDDTTGGDDEDGVTLVGALVRGSNATFRVVASAGGLLNAWIDFNQNGSWAVVPSLFGAVLLIGQDHTLWVGKGMLSRDK